MIGQKKNLCIMQARMGSTRLPGKVLLAVNGQTLLEYEVNRLKQSRYIDTIVVATTDQSGDDPIISLCQKIGVDSFRGSENDVLDRFWQCVQQYPDHENIIRVTGDCPLIDPGVIDNLIELFDGSQVDYACNVMPETFPDGLDAEIFSRAALEQSVAEAQLQSEREHVTLYLRNSKHFKKENLRSAVDYSHLRLTVDNAEDFEVIRFLIENGQSNFSFEQFIEILQAHPEVAKKNQYLTRNEGLVKSLKNDFIIKK